jgi:hypothetical protein
MATIEPPQIRSRARSGTLVDTSGLCSCFMRSCIRQIFKTVTLVCWFSQPCSVCTQFLQKLFADGGYQGPIFRAAPAKVLPQDRIMQKSLTAKMPFKALVCREALMCRTAELGRSTFESFENSKLASAILLTRVAVETSAALWKIGGVVEAGIVGDIDDYLMKLTMGSKTDKSLPKAINVQTFVDQWIRTLVGSATGTMSSANTHILTGRERGFSIPNQTPPTSGRTSARTSARVRLQTDRDPESQRRLDDVREKLQPHR